jgi:hypothetical protein
MNTEGEYRNFLLPGRLAFIIYHSTFDIQMSFLEVPKDLLRLGAPPPWWKAT